MRLVPQVFGFRLVEGAGFTNNKGRRLSRPCSFMDSDDPLTGARIGGLGGGGKGAAGPAVPTCHQSARAGIPCFQPSPGRAAT